ncbi:MAG TPA: M20/M25/M40 family metallo-hydrolase [Limnochordia bacterium]|nr:M20/M25/M40 family metallo-hydrolase [Limnochordia bacterium]
MHINRERLVNEFLTLVQIDSFAGEEREIADYLRRQLTELGLDVTEDDAGKTIGGSAGNIIAQLPGRSDKPTIMFCAHMDRVAPGKGIKPVVEDGIIRSDGTTILGADDAAGIAAILEALRVVKEAGVPHGSLEVVFTIAEEGGLFGAKALDRSRLKADFAYFLDSNDQVGAIINRAPSHQNLDFTFHGKAAHAGVSPELGINAIRIAAEAIASMNLGRIDHETTANAGVIHGGMATNIVPETCTVKCEARSLDPAKLKTQVDHMMAAAQNSAAKYESKVDIKLTDCYPAYTIPDSHPVIQLAAKACRAIGVNPLTKGTGGGSDANILNGKGLPSVVLGLNYKDAHSTGESMAVEDLVKVTELVVSIIEHA